MCSREVTWQIKNISPLSQCLWSQNLSGDVTYRKELPPINSHDPSMRCSCEITWHKKTHHISTCRRPMDINQTRQGADFQWEAPTFKAAWPFDHVTNVRSLDNLENWYFLYHKINSQWTWKCANFSTQMLTSCWV